MAATARDGTIRTRDGRTLSYRVHGPPDGFPVVWHHGTPGSRLHPHHDPRAYDELGVRVLSFDRPGYGGSDPQPARRVASVADDVATLADALGIERFAAAGASGGGPHALACAALLPGRVTRVAALCSPAPADDPELDFTAGMSDSTVAEFEAARESAAAVAAYLAPIVAGLLADPGAVLDALAAELGAVDRVVLARPDFRRALIESSAEGVRRGSQGWIDDDLAFVAPWGFELDEIRAEVRLWQGDDDFLVPRAHGERLAVRLPNARFELVPGMGHMLVDRWPAACAWAAAR